MLGEIDTFLQAVVDHLSTELNQIQQVQVEAVTEAIKNGKIATPGVLVAIEDLSEGEDKGDERLPLACRVTAFCSLNKTTPDAELEIRKFATELFRLVRRKKFELGADVSFPEDFDIGEGVIKQGVEGVVSWFVSWQQTLYLGESVWDPQGIMPDSVYLGQAPDIGTGNEPKYSEVVTPEAP